MARDSLESRCCAGAADRVRQIDHDERALLCFISKEREARKRIGLESQAAHTNNFRPYLSRTQTPFQHFIGRNHLGSPAMLFYFFK